MWCVLPARKKREVPKKLSKEQIAISSPLGELLRAHVRIRKETVERKYSVFSCHFSPFSSRRNFLNAQHAHQICIFPYLDPPFTDTPPMSYYINMLLHRKKMSKPKPIMQHVIINFHVPRFSGYQMAPSLHCLQSELCAAVGHCCLKIKRSHNTTYRVRKHQTPWVTHQPKRGWDINSV